ncbi:hypothetical protein DL93DRAFT_886136 [Clavulina sp. PMI_390]|nr:hypothetical protein DL93DRAFT_886136 [Clavulina sp. PMI_390]
MSALDVDAPEPSKPPSESSDALSPLTPTRESLLIAASNDPSSPEDNPTALSDTDASQDPILQPPSSFKGKKRSHRPVSIIDDALFNSVSSTSTLFDPRRRSMSTLNGSESSSMIPRPLSPSRSANSNALSFRAAGESIAEDPRLEREAGAEAGDYFAGKDSPTRTRSRIPVSSVGHARVLAEENSHFDPSRHIDLIEDARDPSLSSPLDSSRYSLLSGAAPSSPSGGTPTRRSMLVVGGTTKVLSDLQAGVEHAKKALENTKSQLRASQRTVAALTRQTEDLKEGRDRLRLENEGLNNVVARKERLLQEVLERARKAEAEASILKVALKNTTTDTKKSLQSMETSLVEATTKSEKAEREYLALRDSLGSMRETWQREAGELRSEILLKEKEWQQERNNMVSKHQKLLELQQANGAQRSRLEDLTEERNQQNDEFVQYFRQELATLRGQFLDNAQRSSKAEITADYVAGELARIRKLMRQDHIGSDAFEPPHSF